MTLRDLMLSIFTGVRKEEYDTQMRHKEILHNNFLTLEQENRDLNTKLEDLNAEIIDLKFGGTLAIDRFLTTKYKEVPVFAYKNKRKYKNWKYSVYPNEMIQPDKFLVKKARKEIGKLSDDNLKRADQIADYVDRQLHWTSDMESTGMSDYFHSPVESLVSKKVDCDSHTILMASLDPDLFGMAWGKAGDTWHAWNVFEHNGVLWCADTNTTANFTGDGNVRIFRYNNQKRYKIYKIFTKDKTYVLDGSVRFGDIDTL